MILVHGPDELLVRDVVGDLQQRGLAAERLPPDAHLFSEVQARTAGAVVGMLPRHPRADEEEALNLAQDLIDASTAPPAPRVVLVTPAPPYALHVKALKRSGAPYVVISTPTLEEYIPSGYLPNRTTWVARELLGAEHAVATRGGLLEAVARAVADETPVGIELDATRVQLDRALRAAGVRVRAVPAWLARCAALCRQPALCCNEEGKLVPCLGFEPIARTHEALQGAQSA
jgi:hypothetical protein